jgi:AcrR family transcriptional regulator
MDNRQVFPAKPIGIRQRKKDAVRSELKRGAMRLFIAQGYGATTVEHIALEAKISRRTFFRYFVSKEALLFDDELDEVLARSFRAQPSNISVVRAFRNALRITTSQLLSEQQAYERQRHQIIASTPELQARASHEVARSAQFLGALIGERLHKSPTDSIVLTLAGAIQGVVMVAEVNAPTDGNSNLSNYLDQALVALENIIKEQ